MSKIERKTQLVVRVSEEEKEKVRKESEKQGVSISGLIRQFINVIIK